MQAAMDVIIDSAGKYQYIIDINAVVCVRSSGIGYATMDLDTVEYETRNCIGIFKMQRKSN